MQRRELLKLTTAGVGTWMAGELSVSADAKVERSTAAADVLVVGGGTAGTIAAIQAARAGAKTRLVEMGSQLGGTTTTGGVNYPGLFHAWGRQIIAGIGWELVVKAVELDSGVLPDFATPYPPGRHWKHQVRVNGQLYAALAEEACLTAGVTLHYYELPRSVKAVAGGWELELIGKGVEHSITCKQLIDCTGGADIAGMAGLARLRENTTQPGTMIFELGGYQADKLDAKLIQSRYEEALQQKRLMPGDVSHARGRFVDFLRGGGFNAEHVFGADSSTSETKTQSNIAGRKSVLRLLRFVRSLPGCERARLLRMQTETAVRETYRIVGEVQITQADYSSGRVFDDAVCHSFYPIDLHDREGVRPQPLREGVVPTVPLRALVPKGSRNLLAAGRCVSSDRLANSALRVQASCMAMGQAAGAAAALAARRNVAPRDVPMAELKDVLRHYAAIVP